MDSLQRLSLDTSSSAVPGLLSPTTSSNYSSPSSPSTNTTHSPGRASFYLEDYNDDETCETADTWYQAPEFWYPRIHALCEFLWPGADHIQTKVALVDSSDYYKNFSISISSSLSRHEDYVLRLPVLEDSLLSTVSLLRHLAQLAEANDADIKLPELVCHDTTTANALRYPYLILRRVQGVTVREAWPELSHAQRIEVAREVAQLYVQLRWIRSPVAGSLHADMTSHKYEDDEADEIDSEEEGSKGRHEQQQQRQWGQHRHAAATLAPIGVTAFGNAFWDDGARDVDWYVADNGLLPLRALRRDCPPDPPTAALLRLPFRRRLYQRRCRHRPRGRRATRKEDDDAYGGAGGTDDGSGAAVAGRPAGGVGGDAVAAALYEPCLRLIDDMDDASDVFERLDREVDTIDHEVEQQGREGCSTRQPFHLWHTALHPSNIVVYRTASGAIAISAVLDWEEEQVVFAPEFVAAEPPRWLWAAGARPGDDPRLGQRGPDLNLEPLSAERIDLELEAEEGVVESVDGDEQDGEEDGEARGRCRRLAIKRTFERIVGAAWCRRAYNWELAIARRVFMLSLVYPYPVGNCHQLEELEAAWYGRLGYDGDEDLEGPCTRNTSGDAVEEDPEFARQVEMILEGLENLGR